MQKKKYDINIDGIDIDAINAKLAANKQTANIRVVKPDKIFAEHLPKLDNAFWRCRGYNKDKYTKHLAALPAVYDLILRGKINTVMLFCRNIENNDTKNAARIYFQDTRIKVVEDDGKYQLVSDGVHRWVAARLTDMPIPVQIINRKSENRKG